MLHPGLWDAPTVRDAPHVHVGLDRYAVTMRSMHLTRLFTVGLCLSLCASARAEAPEFSKVDAAIESAIERGEIPGAVVLIAQGDQVLHRKAFGHRALLPSKEEMTVDTIFDLASISKCVGMTTSIMTLVDEGKIALDDPVAKHIPAFGANGKEKVTIEQLLLHRGGLAAGNSMSEYADGPEKAMERIYAIGLKYEPGTDYVYTDLGPIVLGALVKAVDDRPLDQYAKEEVFEPLGMDDTAYNPPAAWQDRIAPTETRNGEPIRGEVHDPRAYALGGVAGHAGLFGTADDLARWCRMMLNGGELEGTRILSDEIVSEMTKMRCLPDGSGCRGYGVDVFTEGSSLRGEHFPAETTYGHTGWTGTSFIVDPVNDVYVILLTSRCHPGGEGNAGPVRKAVSTAAAEALGIE